MNTDREERLQQYLDERMDSAERATFEKELLADSELMAAAYDEISVRDALKESSQARRIVALGTRHQRRKWALPFLALATAASIAFLVFVLPNPVEKDVFRGEATSAPQAIHPTGQVQAPITRFVWTADSAASNYRLEIFDSSDNRIFVTATKDTFLVPGPEVEFPSAGYWKATSLDSIGVGVRGTGRVEFQIPD